MVRVDCLGLRTPGRWSKLGHLGLCQRDPTPDLLALTCHFLSKGTESGL